MNVTERVHQSVSVCVCVCLCMCGVVMQKCRDVALSTVNLQLLRCLNERESPPHLVTVQFKMGTW